MDQLDNKKLKLYIKTFDELIYRGFYKKAVEISDEFLKIYPQSIVVLEKKSSVLNQIGEHDDAIKICNVLLNIDPQNFSALLNKGRSLNSLRKYEEELEFLIFN